MIFVEHDMDVVMDISDWVVVMAEGRIIAEGPPDADRRQPTGSSTPTSVAPTGARRRRGIVTGEGRWRSTSWRELLVPVVNIAPATCPASTSSTAVARVRRASSSASSARTVPASRPCSRRCSASSTVRDGQVTFAGRRHHRNTAPTSWSSGASATCRRPTTSSRQPHGRRRTSRWGRILPSRDVRRSPRRTSSSCSPGSASVSSQRAGRSPGGERQMVAMGRALMMEPRCCCSTSRRPASRRPLQDRGVRPDRRRSTQRGSRSSWSSRTPAGACRSVDRGYVLDQGRNAYTDTGRDLLKDPKVIELYLGTLAQVD